MTEVQAPPTQNRPAIETATKQRLLPAERGQVVHRQCQQRQSHQVLECPTLEGSLLEMVDLEDGQEQPEVDEVAQERAEAPAAGLGLARIEGREPPVPRLRLAGRARTAGAAPASLRPSFGFLAPCAGPPRLVCIGKGVAFLRVARPVPPVSCPRGALAILDGSSWEPIPADGSGPSLPYLLTITRGLQERRAFGTTGSREVGTSGCLETAGTGPSVNR